MKMTLVSFQGERGAYSEAAARAFFNYEIDTVPHPTFADALDSTSIENTQYTILPVENSIEGSVGESYDLLYSTKLNVVGEIYHKIEHCLIGIGSVKEIDTIYSHPQALGQCRRFIKEHKIKTIPAYDTAGSVNIVKELNTPKSAAIASEAAASIYQIPVIARDIADNLNNYTRFLILSNYKTSSTKNDKTSIIFSIKHEPGSLFRIISNFHANNVNLTKIESRPTRKNTWEYNFYLDFEGHETDPKISTMLSKIRDDTIFIKILGSYKATKT